MRELLAGRYRILDRLGEGGMGAVYRAEDQDLDELVALKMLRSDVATAPGVLDRFKREVKLARRVTHENVARVYELGQEDGQYFLTMELIAGRALRFDEPLTAAEAAPLVRGICAGLDAAHAVGVVHRDVKPENVLISDDGRVVLTDFGIARQVAALSRTAGATLGTPAYMAPEQIDSSNITPQTDLFSLGVMLFEMLTGTLPWSADTPFGAAFARLKAPPPDPRTLSPELPDPVATIILACLQVDPQDRPPNAMAIAAAFGVETPPPALSRRPVPPPRARMRLAVLPLAGGSDVAGALTQELIDGLGQVRALRVLSRRVTTELADRPLAELRAELDVDRVIEGRVNGKDGGHRIVVRLLDAHSGEQLETLQRTARTDEILTTADELVRRLSESMDAVPATVARPRAIEPAAVELYLKARAHHHQFMMDEALTLLTEAEKMAPDHPLLLAGLAVARARQSFTDPDESKPSLSTALTLAGKAVRIAPDHGEPRFALGYVRFHSGDSVGAVIALRQAIARSPSSAEALAVLGEILLEVGRPDEARRRLELSLSLDPGQSAPRWALARLNALAGDFDTALGSTRALYAQTKEPRHAAPIGRLLGWKRDLEGMRALMSSLGPTSATSWIMSNVPFLAAIGEVPAGQAYLAIDALASVDVASNRLKTLMMQVKAELASLLGDRETAMQALTRGNADGLMDVHWVDNCPVLGPLRTAEGYGAIRAEMGARAERVVDAVWGGEGPTAQMERAP